jgi:hypothetical protein
MLNSVCFATTDLTDWRFYHRDWYTYSPKFPTFGMFFLQQINAVDGLFTVAYPQPNDPHYDAFCHLQPNPLDIVPYFSGYFGSYVSD